MLSQGLGFRCDLPALACRSRRRGWRSGCGRALRYARHSLTIMLLAPRSPAHRVARTHRRYKQGQGRLLRCQLTDQCAPAYETALALGSRRRGWGCGNGRLFLHNVFV